MKRRVFNVLATLSLLLFLTTSVMWVRSQFVFDRIVRGSVQRQPPASVDWFNVSSYRSSVDVSWDRNTYAGPDQSRFDPGGPTNLRWLSSPPTELPLPQEPPSTWNEAGFVFEQFHEVDGDSTFNKLRAAIPYWALLALSGILPTWGLAKALWKNR